MYLSIVTHTLCLIAVLIHNYSTQSKWCCPRLQLNRFYVEPADAPKNILFHNDQLWHKNFKHYA
jgi:hypothetical protein